MKILKNIMKVNEFDNPKEKSVWYRTSCACGENDCDCTIVIESDKERPLDVEMIFYKNVSWADYYGVADNFISRMIKRVQCALKVLFTGYIQLEESFLFNDEEHIDNFVKAIQEGLRRVNE